MMNWSRNTPGARGKGVTVQNFTVWDSMSFVKPQFAQTADPWVVVETITYKNGSLSQLMSHWKDQVAESKNELGTLAFGVYGDPHGLDRVYILGAYETRGYMTDTHSKSQTAINLESRSKDLRTNKEQSLLQRKGGFLYKSPDGCG